MSLLSDIEKAATTSSEPLPDLLRRCKVLAARLKHAEFAEWVSRELNGYSEDDELPDYRIVDTPNALGTFTGPFGSGAKNMPLPLALVPDELRERLERARFPQSIAELQQLAKKDTGLRTSWPGNVVAVLQTKFSDTMVLVEASSPLSPGAITGILDTVRTRVLDFVLALQSENPDAGESPPNAAKPPIQPQTVTNVFHSTIIGGHANIGTSGNATIDNSDAHNSFLLDGAKTRELAPMLEKARGDAEKLPKEQKEATLATIAEVEAAAKTKRFTPEKVAAWTNALSAAGHAGYAAAPHVVDLVHWLTALAGA